MADLAARRCARCQRARPDVARDSETDVPLCDPCWAVSRPVIFDRNRWHESPSPGAPTDGEEEDCREEG